MLPSWEPQQAAKGARDYVVLGISVDRAYPKQQNLDGGACCVPAHTPTQPGCFNVWGDNRSVTTSVVRINA